MKKLSITFLPLLLLVVSSCTSISITKIENDRIDRILYNDQEYLVPLPKDYCKYDPKDKDDRSVITFLNGPAEEEKETKMIALYEESCETKKRVISGDLRDSPKSIRVDVKNGDESEYVTRSQLIGILYNDHSDEIEGESARKFLTKSYENLTEERLLKYGFSKKRVDLLREDLKGFAEKSDVKIKKDKDQYASYLMRFMSNNSLSEYSVTASTKINNRLVTITIYRILESAEYSRLIAHQFMKYSKEYIKNFVEINDKNDYRTFISNGRKIKIYTPEGFLSIPSEEKKFIEGKYNKLLNKELASDDRYKKFGKDFLDFKAVFFQSKHRGELNAILPIAFINIPNLNSRKFTSREECLDLFYAGMKKSNTIENKDLTPDYFSKEKNGIFSVSSINDYKTAVSFITLINGIPIQLMAEFSNSKTKITQSDLNKFKKELINYVDFLDINQ